VILHHPGAVHGTLPATRPGSRRAITNVYADEQVLWAPHPGDGFQNEALMGHQPMPELSPGDPLECELFPAGVDRRLITAAGRSKSPRCRPAWAHPHLHRITHRQQRTGLFAAHVEHGGRRMQNRAHRHGRRKRTLFSP